MTMPNAADGLSPNVELAFAISGDGQPPSENEGIVSLGGQADLDQETVQNILKSRMQNSTGWNSASETAFDGLLGDTGLPLITRIIFTALGSLFNFDLSGLNLDGLLQLFEPIRDFLTWLFETFEGVLESILQPILEWLTWLWKLFANITPNPAPTGPGADILVPLFTWLDWLWEQFGASVESVLKPLFEWLNWLWQQFGDAVETVLKPIFEWLNWLWKLAAGITPNPAPTGSGADILVPLFTWLKGLIDAIGATVLGLFTGLLDSVSGLISLDTLKSLIEKIANSLTAIISPQGFTDMLIKIIEYFKSLFIAGDITDFTKNLPIVSQLVSAITGLTEADGVSLDFGTLNTFFRQLEEKAKASKDALNGQIQGLLGGILSIGMLNTTEPNLISQGDFATAATIEPGGGWSWDNTASATSTGGSAKATCTGSLQELFSKQSIQVKTGDKFTVSCKALTRDFTSGTIVLSIIPWAGTTQGTTQVLATRTTSSATFAAGAMSSPTLVIGTGEAGQTSLPSNTTSITVRLAVTANSGAKVWFDEVVVKKTGLVEQNWVNKLPETWQGAWNAVFGSGGTGKIWSDFITALSTVNSSAGLAYQNADTAKGNVVTVIDDIGKAVFGEAGYASLSNTTKQSIRKLVSTLFGLDYVATELSGEVLPPIDGTTITGEIPVGAVPDLPGGIITSGTVQVNYLPTGEISSALGTTGSGAKMSRTFTTGFFPANAGGNIFINFWNNLERASADITVWPYASQFTVTQTGWYIVEVGFTVNANPGYVGYFNVAPAVFVNGALNKVGGDSLGSYGGGFGNWSRSAQGSFIVYLAAGNTVQGGYYNYGTTINDFFQGQAGGYACYMSMSMLNKGLGA